MTRCNAMQPVMRLLDAERDKSPVAMEREGQAWRGPYQRPRSLTRDACDNISSTITRLNLTFQYAAWHIIVVDERPAAAELLLKDRMPLFPSLQRMQWMSCKRRAGRTSKLRYLRSESRCCPQR
jgi:hypothetical protein